MRGPGARLHGAGRAAGRPGKRAPLPLLSLLLTFPSVLTWLLGCGSAVGPSVVSRPAAEDGGGEIAPWEIAAGAVPSQRLYRLKYEGPEGDASFKLTLYLESPTRYRMTAADGLGRKLWSLQVDAPGSAVWLDHRRDEYCRAQGGGELTLVPLAHLPLASLPKLLLGRLPANPAADLKRSDHQIAYRDVRGQQWTAELTGDDPKEWRLVEHGQAIAWWRRDGDGGSFAVPRAKQEIRWQEIVREALSEPLAPLEIPARYREAACGDTADL